MNSKVKRFARVLVGGLIFLGAIALSVLLWITRPVAEQKPFVESVPVVEVATVKLEEVRLSLPTQGLIEADRRADLAAEVAGRVVETNPEFEVGLRAKEGDWLVRIDATDYRAAVATAASTLAEARSALVEEQARAEQAKRDWAKLGGGGAPNELVSRVPQLRAATARVESAEAALAKAEADLARTEIKAPFDCVIASKRTEIGSYVNPGAVIAAVFESSPYEIRLPIPVDQLPLLDLKNGVGEPGGVEITSRIGDGTHTYPGRIIRTEGEIDRASRSAYLVAEVADPPDGTGLLQPGLFVRAHVQGRALPDVAKVPFAAFVDLNRVALVSPDNTLQFREVNVIFREGDTVYVSSGLQNGDRLCLTELPSMITGLKVEPKTAAPASPESGTPPAL